MKTIRSVDVLRQGSDLVGKEVNVKGWVRTKRGNSAVNFIALNDGSTVHSLQVVADVANFDAALLKQVTTGACISATGTLLKSRRHRLRCWALPTLKNIRCRKRVTAWSFCVRLHICVSAPTISVA